MFNKFTTFSIDKSDVVLIDDNLLKTASVKLPDGIKYDPGFLYLKLRGVSAGEYYGDNKNGDYFPENELVNHHHTFLNAHAFKNHENKDVANAIGDVLSSEWDDKMKSVILIIRVDRKIAPTIVRGFEKGFMTDVSMGCRIKHSICSICGNIAKKKSEYCSHINTMRRQILDDGRKVFEINIEPKFHDISAVLSGAEKVAKVTGILIVGDKVAFNMPDELEKVASYEMLSENDIRSISCLASEKLADNIDIFHSIEKTAKLDMQKIAEIKKEIQSKIINMASEESVSEKFKNADRLRELIKLLATKFWDRQKCEKIANKINEIASENNVSKEVAFDQFLKVLEFAGIELSPLEFNSIFENLIGHRDPETKNMDTLNNVDDVIDKVDKVVEENDMGEYINIPEMFSVIKNIIPERDVVLNATRGARPISRLKSIIVKIKKPTEAPDEDIMFSDIMNIIKGEIPQRSNHRTHIINRVMSPDFCKDLSDNTEHFTPALRITRFGPNNTQSLKDALSSLFYSLYQGNRVKNVNSNMFNYGLNKFASYIEGESIDNILNEDYLDKEAGLGKGYTVRKGLVYGLPAVFGYSALQRSRMRSGENISGFNRYVAENPGNAYLGQALLGPQAAKKMKVVGKKLYTKGKNVSSKHYMKSASELYDGDIFKEASIQKDMLSCYSEDQISAIKYASILMEADRESLSNEILELNKLSSEDLENYTNICKNHIRGCIDSNIEKIAYLKGSALNTGIDMMFRPKKTALLSTLPGHIADGVLFTVIGKKLSDSAKKKQQISTSVQKGVN